MSRAPWFILVLASCQPPHSSLDSTSLPVVTHCESGIGDGGVFRLGQVVHINAPASFVHVENGQAIAAADGGICFSAEDAGVATICAEPNHCVTVTAVRDAVAFVRAFSFGRVPLGKRSTQTARISNRLGTPISVSITTDVSEFELRPASFTIPALGSVMLTASFQPSRLGDASGHYFLHEAGSPRIEVFANGVGGGALLEVQPFIDAGIITPVLSRSAERRRLLISNVSAPGTENRFEPGTVQVRTTCSDNREARVRVWQPFTLEPGQSGFFDLLIEPIEVGRERTCQAELLLERVWYPVELAFRAMDVALVSLNDRPLQFPSDGGLEIRVRNPSLEPAYLSWPRLEQPDAGLELIADWSEAIVPPDAERIVFVRQTRPSPALPNAFLVDGNFLAPARWEIR